MRLGRTTVVLLLVLLVSAIAGVACGSDDDDKDSTPAAGQSGATAPGGQAAATAQRIGGSGSVLATAQMRSQYSEQWLKLAQVDGKQSGIFIKAALKGPIWYNTKTFSQVNSGQPPKTFDELIALSKTIADSGATP